jgi:amidohydrolase
MEKHCGRFGRLVRLAALPVLLVPWLADDVPAAADGRPARPSDLETLAAAVEPKVVAWRRDIHQHPELGNREVRTAAIVAAHLRSLGLEVTTGVAHTGVVGVLRGRAASPVVALRADMDALPVKELADLPYASHLRAQYNGREVDVAHACGHDAHTAILMGVAEVLAARAKALPGTVKFLFQPAEDSRPDGEAGGASEMIRAGVLDQPKVDAIFGLHVGPLPHGTVAYRPQGAMAGVSVFTISVSGRQTHGALPWAGIDPIPVAAQVILALQTIVSRQLDLTAAPAVLTVGTLSAGTQNNIVAGSVEMTGTIRTFTPGAREDVAMRIRRTAEGVASGGGASAAVSFSDNATPVVFNDPALAARMVPALERAAGRDQVTVIPPLTVGEDFAFYQEKVPGLFFFLGTNAPGADPRRAAANHSPYFTVDDSALVVGVRALSSVAVAYLEDRAKR